MKTATTLTQLQYANALRNNDLGVPLMHCTVTKSEYPLLPYIRSSRGQKVDIYEIRRHLEGRDYAQYCVLSGFSYYLRIIIEYVDTETSDSNRIKVKTWYRNDEYLLSINGVTEFTLEEFAAAMEGRNWANSTDDALVAARASENREIKPADAEKVIADTLINSSPEDEQKDEQKEAPEDVPKVWYCGPYTISIPELIRTTANCSYEALSQIIRDQMVNARFIATAEGGCYELTRHPKGIDNCHFYSVAVVYTPKGSLFGPGLFGHTENSIIMIMADHIRARHVEAKL